MRSHHRDANRGATVCCRSPASLRLTNIVGCAKKPQMANYPAHHTSSLYCFIVSYLLHFAVFWSFERHLLLRQIQLAAEMCI